MLILDENLDQILLKPAEENTTVLIYMRRGHLLNNLVRRNVHADFDTGFIVRVQPLREHTAQEVPNPPVRLWI